MNNLSRNDLNQNHPPSAAPSAPFNTASDASGNSNGSNGSNGNNGNNNANNGNNGNNNGSNGNNNGSNGNNNGSNGNNNGSNGNNNGSIGNNNGSNTNTNDNDNNNNGSGTASANGPSNSTNNSNINSNLDNAFRPQGLEYGQQQSYSFPPLQYQQPYQQQQQQHPQYFPYPNQHQYPHQQQPAQQPNQYGHVPSDSYRPLGQDAYGTNNNYNQHVSQRPPDDYAGQEGPTRSHRRGMSSEYSHSVRFNPSRNYNADSYEQGTFLSRPKILGLPCIACSMSRTPCDGGSPCRPCLTNRVRCHYEGDNNTRFFGIDALQLDQPLSLHQQQQQHQQQPLHDSRDNPDNHISQSGSTDPSPLSHPSRSRSRSDSGSGSISGSGSGSGSGSSHSGRGTQDHPYPQVSPLISTPITLSDQSLISIPPFQELSRQDRAQHNKVTLPSISSMGSSIVPLCSASLSSTSSQNSRSSSTSKTSSSSSRASYANNGNGGTQPGGSVSKFSSERPILPIQRLSASRVPSLAADRAGSSQSGSTDADTIVRRQPTKKQQQAQAPKDPLYSLSSASIRARKNALEMENIQRASHLYADYIAKIKALSLPAVNESEISSKIKATYLSESDPLFNKMDLDMDESRIRDQAKQTTTPGDEHSPAKERKAVSSNVVPATSCGGGASSESACGPIEGLKSMSRSGLLHSLVQQYFTLIHPQFMILHKNQFLVRFWAQYGPFPEAKELHLQILHSARPENMWRGPIETATGSNGSEEQGSSPSDQTSPLLLLAMLALVSRHINDRMSLKSTAADKQRRIEKSLALISAEYSSDAELSQCKEKAQEARLQDLMETDEQGQSETGENLQDRGEQYFQWASEQLKVEYEEPSLSVVQSLLLLREYAVMAGNHSQAYMYGGTAITMAMGLGWHHSHLVQTGGREHSSDATGQTNESAEGQSEEERNKTSRIKGEEQKLCWWHCFIVDRWMSATHNRPVNIPVHIFDKTHLRPIKNIPQATETENAPATESSLTPGFWLTPGGPDTAALSSSLKKSGGVDMLPIGSGAKSGTTSLPGATYRTKLFFDQQCRQALLLDDILCFLSSWSDDLFVSSAEFEKLSTALDEWHRSLMDWQQFPLSGIVSAVASSSRSRSQKADGTDGRKLQGMTTTPTTSTNAEEGRDVVQSTLLGITFHTVRILLYRPFLRTNMRHPPCLPARASAVCAQSANAITSLAEYLMNQTDATVQPCLLMRHQFSLVTAAGIQQMNANLDEEPRLSTPAKINLLKTIRILRDADRSTWGAGVKDGFHQVLRELFPAQMKQMYD